MMHSQHFFLNLFHWAISVCSSDVLPVSSFECSGFLPMYRHISCRFGYGSVVSPCVGAVFVLYPPSPVHVTSEKVTSDMSGGGGGVRWDWLQPPVTLDR